MYFLSLPSFCHAHQQRLARQINPKTRASAPLSTRKEVTKNLVEPRNPNYHVTITTLSLAKKENGCSKLVTKMKSVKEWIKRKPAALVVGRKKFGWRDLKVEGDGGDGEELMHWRDLNGGLLGFSCPGTWSREDFGRGVGSAVRDCTVHALGRCDCLDKPSFVGLSFEEMSSPALPVSKNDGDGKNLVRVGVAPMVVKREREALPTACMSAWTEHRAKLQTASMLEHEANLDDTKQSPSRGESSIEILNKPLPSLPSKVAEAVKMIEVRDTNPFRRSKGDLKGDLKVDGRIGSTLVTRKHIEGTEDTNPFRRSKRSSEMFEQDGNPLTILKRVDTNPFRRGKATGVMHERVGNELVARKRIVSTEDTIPLKLANNDGEMHKTAGDDCVTWKRVDSAVDGLSGDGDKSGLGDWRSKNDEKFIFECGTGVRGLEML